MKKFLVFLAVSVLTASCAWADTPINSYTFPDNNFREFVKNFDINHNSILENSEIASISELRVSDMNISSLEGIETFTSLKTLVCQHNSLTQLDLSGKTQLEAVTCGYNQLESLNVSGCKKLRVLFCENNRLTSLTLKDSPELQELFCYGNPITEPVIINNYVHSISALREIARRENIHSSNITAIDSEGNSVDFLGFDASELFASVPVLARYEYTTGLDSVKLLVTAMSSNVLDNVKLTAAVMSSEAKGFASCTNGIFEGKTSGNIITWKGIPYAKQPVGSLRWKAPQAPDMSSEVFDAFTFASTPIQHITATNPAQLMPQGEDCLALNVWNNGADTENLKPVMVWIHGGAFNSGGTANPDYDMQNFIEAHNDVVAVSVGYRVGMMGFIDFANSGLQGAENFTDSGNLGLLDIMQALRWLKQNVKAFGGDPENITLFGQSSGASSIALIMAMPEAAGLFKRAIIQSGSVSMTSGVNDCLPLTQALVKLTGAKSMNDLLALSSSDLQAAAEKLQALTNFPERDGIHIAANPFEAFAQNSINFDVMTGTMADEINYWALALGNEGFAKFIPMAFYQIAEGIGKVNSADGEIPEKFVADYMTEHDDATELEAMSQFLNDLLFRVPALTGLENYAGRKYLYYWTQGVPGLGACHALDVPYVLNSKNTLIGLFINGINHDLSKNIQSMWINFAKTGTPSESWPEYNTVTRSTMLISNSPSVSYGHLAERFAQVSPLIKYGISGRELINGMASSDDDNPGGDTESPDISPDVPPDASPDVPPDVPPDVSPNLPPNLSPDVKDTAGPAGGGCNSGFMLSAMFSVICFALMKKD